MKFPDNISYGASGGPNFNTTVIQTVSGKTKRSRNWSTPQYTYECAHGLKTQQQLDELIEFFWEVGGMAEPFRFKDWSDYKVDIARSVIERPTTESLKLFKKYGSYTRRIHKVVSGTFKLYANNVLVNTGFSLDNETGIVTLQNPPDYSPSTAFSYECEFDVWVTFGTDFMRPSIDNYNIYNWNQIPLIEEKVTI